MSLHLDVYTRLDDRSIRSASDRLHSDLERAGGRAGGASGRAFGEQFGRGMERGAPSAVKLEKATDKVATALGRVNVEQEKHNRLVAAGETDRVKLVTQSERLADATRKHTAAVREAVQAQRDHDVSLQGMASAAQGAASTVAGLGVSLGNLGKIGGPVAIAAVAQGLAAVVPVAASAAQSIALLPGVLGSAGAAFGSLQLATAGFGDAMESLRDPQGFSEALRSLSPNAQQAALSIQHLLPQFDQLKNVTQDALFAGVGQQINSLANQYLPAVQQLTTGVAGAFNQAFAGVANQLMTPETQSAITAFIDNVNQSFRNLAPAAAPLTKALAEITAAGSGVLPELAGAAADAARSFSQFITEASKSGALSQFMADGLDTMKQLGGLVLYASQRFFELANSDSLPAIIDSLKGMVDTVTLFVKAAEFSPVVTGLQTIHDLMQLISGDFTGVGDVAVRVGQVAHDALMLLMGPLGPLFKLLNIDTSSALDNARAAADDARRGGVFSGGGPFDRATAGLSPLPPGGLPGPTSLGGGAGIRMGQAGTGWGPSASTGNGGGPKLPDAPVLPYDSSLPPGMSGPPNASVFGAQSSWLDARHDLAEKQARLAQLESSGVATAEDIQAAKNDVLEAERDQQAAQLRLVEAQQSATQKYTKSLQGTASELGEIGVQLDSDFGISKGLAGIAENITRFVAGLAFAPALGALSAVSAASPSKGGYGLMGILGAQGVFGDKFTGIDQQQQGYGYQASAMGPAGLNLMSPSILKDTGSVPSGPQSRMAAGLIEQMFGDQLRGPIGGSRDSNTAPGTHDAGLSIDIPIGPDQMALGDQIRNFLHAHAQELGLEYTIWRDQGVYPGTGGKTSFTTPGHQNHIDAHFDGKGGALSAGSGPVPVNVVNGSSMLSGFNWDAVAAKESSGNWQNADTGNNGHYGGLQFSPSTWNAFGGQQFAPMPHQATREQQMAVADRTAFYGYNGTPPQGLGAWEVITNGSTAADGITVNSRPPQTWGGPTGIPNLVGGGGESYLGQQQGPGVGGGAGTRIGAAVSPPAGMGAGGIGITPGGTLDTAIGIGASMLPGAGQAAQTLVKLGNRAIQYGGQVAGIGAQGLMETFLPTGGSELAQNNWLTRIVGGLAGSAPTLPNVAGDKQPTPEQVANIDPNTQQGARTINSGNTTNINVDSKDRNTGQGIANDIAYHQAAMYDGPG